MNFKMIGNTVGKVALIESGLLVLPLITSIIYQESSVWSILITMAIALILGALLLLIFRPKDRVIYSKEGFIIVAFAWIVLSLIGAIPFTISGEIPSYIDALFETVSGFTTTGSSILTNVEGLSKSLLMWRSFSQWIGGMGILVFVIALMPKSNDRSIHILRAEMPGPSVDKLVPHSKDTAKILYLIYIGLTGILIALLAFGEMDLYESIVHALATAGTGGFGIKNVGLAAYSSYSQWVIAIFMLLYGINFNLYFLILVGKFKSLFKNTEFLTYLGIVIVTTILVCLNVYPLFNNLSDTIRTSFFQVSSIVTTTGYATYDFTYWNSTTQILLIFLMFIGGSSGSTAGGFKVSRIVIIFKRIKYELKKLINPRSVDILSMDGKRIDDAMVNSTTTYLGIYILTFATVLTIISLDGFDFLTNFSATLACINNIGPGLSLVGPMANYSTYSPLSKIVLSFAMLLGRLEIYPLLLALSPSVWFKK